MITKSVDGTASSRENKEQYFMAIYGDASTIAVKSEPTLHFLVFTGAS